MSAIDRLEAALAAHGCDPKRRGDHIDALCPTHDDVNPSLDVDPGYDGRALATCRAGCPLKGILAALELSWGDLFDVDPSRNGKPEITAEYPYTDEQGNLLFQVVRYAPKNFRQRRPDGAGGWTWKLGSVRRVPYRLPELIAAVGAGRWIVVVEGEKDVDRLIREGFVATTNAGGATKFLPGFATYFAGAKVAILPDNDGPGRAHARQVAASLVASAETVKVIALPGPPEHGDVSDWLDAGRRAAELRQIIVEAPLWTHDEAATEKVSVPPGSENPEEVDSAELLDNVVAALQRYVVFRLDAQAVAIALWVLNTYVFDLHDSTPYLHIRSATKQSGKSRLLEVLALLVNRPWSAVEATEAVLFRKIEASAPTLLLDEIDAAFGKDSTMTEGLRAVLNAGYRRGATVPRCVGPQHELRDFAVFCPKAFAGIGATLPDTVMDRAIPIELRRRSPHERQPARFRQARARAELTPLRDRIRMWARTAGERLTGAEPELPDALGDRQQDSWEPLLAVADLANGEWPNRARAAAATLHAGVSDQDVSVLLLTHLRELFEERDAETVSTEEVLTALVNRGDDSPWARWWGEDVERQQTKGPGSQLARKLKPYGIKPEQLWLSGSNTRGYRRSDFDDSWGRYLSSEVSTGSLPPHSDARALDRKSEASSGQHPSEVESGPEQDPSVLASSTGDPDSRTASRRVAAVNDLWRDALDDALVDCDQSCLPFDDTWEGSETEDVLLTRDIAPISLPADEEGNVSLLDGDLDAPAPPLSADDLHRFDDDPYVGVTEAEAVRMVETVFGRCEIVEHPCAACGARMTEPNANRQWVHSNCDLDGSVTP